MTAIIAVDALSTTQQDAVRTLAGRAERSDGVAPLGEQPLLSLSAGGAEVAHLLAVEGDDEAGVVGYAQVDLGGATASAELVVEPEARRRGIGSALLARVRTAAPDGLAVWAHGDLPGAQALARSAGMRAARELWRMHRALPDGGRALPEGGSSPGADPAADPASAPALPSDVHVHAFRPGVDEERWLAVNARAFATHPEQGRLTRADLDARMAEPWFEAGDLLLVEATDVETADAGGLPLAFLWLKVLPGEPTGELYVLGVDPSAQGRGLGGALTALALRHLRARGCTDVVLYVDGDNTAAVRTYERAGFTRAALDVQYVPS